MASTIPFVVSPQNLPAGPAGTSGTKGVFGGASTSTQAVVAVPVDKLRASLQSVSESFLETLADIKSVGKFQLKEVTVKVEVSAEGGVHFIGSATASATGAIELKFVLP